MRDRLIEKVNRILKDNFEHVPLSAAINVADDLLAQGVLAPPCKVNQFVYVIDRVDIQQPIKEKIVLEIQCGYSGNLIVLQDTPFRFRRAYLFSDFGKTVFPTKEEAEKALKALMGGEQE